MRQAKFLLDLIQSAWLISEQAGIQGLPFLLESLYGEKKAGFYDDEDEQSEEQKEAKKFKKVCSIFQVEGSLINKSQVNSFSDPAIPAGSTAFIKVQGSLTKADGWCNTGTETMARWLQDAIANPNIKGVVLEFDTPGGQVAGTENFANAVYTSSKPVVAYVNGQAASGGYWVASQADHIVINGETSEVGSIGVMISFWDMMAYYKKMGITLRIVRSDGSEMKNEDFLQMMNGNDKPIKQSTLNPIRTVFVNTVLRGRSESLSENPEIFTGKMFFSKNAIDLGMVDEMGTLSTAIAKVDELASADYKSFKQKKMSKASKLMAAVGVISTSAASLDSFKGKKAEELTAEEIDAFNETLAKEGYSISVLPTTTMEALEQKIESQEANVAALTKERDEWKEKAESYGSQPGTVVIQPKSEKKKEGDDLSVKTEEVDSTTKAALELQKSMNGSTTKITK